MISENRNTILAIVLSLIVLLGWQYFVANPELERQQAALQTQQQAEAERQAANGGANPDAPQPSAAPGSNAALPAQGADRPAVFANREQAVAADKRVVINSPRLEGSINLSGGRLDDLRLKDYHETVDKSSPTIALFSPKGSPNPYYTDYGWVADPGANVPLPGPDTVWSVDGETTLTPTTPLTLVWNNGAGLTFKRTFSVDENYLFTVAQSVENTSSADVTLYPYGLIARKGVPETTGIWILHEGLLGVFGEEGLQEIDYSDLEDEGTIRPASVDNGWLGITDKYWAATLMPVPGQEFQPSFSFSRTTGNFQADYLGTGVAVPAGGTAETSSYLFAGAKETKLIDAYEESLNLNRFELMIDWGWFYFLTKPMFFAIDYFFHLIGNFGVAILVVTVIIKLIFFPLANKSYVSMSKMKLAQPQMTEIREKYSDDRQKQQQALMELYKKEKINPLAGCLPILIQIPVFFALYKVLFVTIEMRHAPFFGWIQDLSAPDPTSLFNLFGLIPWDPPQLLMLGVWPLVMGISMFVQMKMNPAPPDPTQQMIFTWMPVVFTFMLASFPAGLVIYWAWNNTLSITQQYVIMRRQGAKVELWDNIGSMFKRKKPASDDKG
ncbi:Oxa1Ec [Roseibium album]|uniref:Membrane protein insertase YidC n=1 Tax=Roseibium album TaxID=311410 RepID=A0A0M6ZGW7_9HYPH|nr:YidC/Oxa1 family membrane protein insertase [Labrenzia sp. EL_162]MBG6193123.1 YidC/Oxa1 family membrane protein insertase [Labrenzia sp. EL_159]MBG6199488.1 YidC/Oxa1 family membrane protein insertase [Labrenzia sp. EL_13]MCR9058306.1 membrane protein insertase YidC [Paracoccaceae bacterium]CTQ62009.1 Oxa1Ec [Roseibium album]